MEKSKKMDEFFLYDVLITSFCFISDVKAVTCVLARTMTSFWVPNCVAPMNDMPHRLLYFPMKV